MLQFSIRFLACLIFIGSHFISQAQETIVTSDITNFWKAYDKVTSTEQESLQQKYLWELYLSQGTPGLKAIMEARNYTAEDYLEAIRNYPRFWESVRDNTLRADQYAMELEKGVEKLRKIYPDLKPATIYFTIGALRTGGTTVEDKVLIGSELAMSDENTVSDELPENSQAGRRKYFDSNPINDLVLLNVHEYVHTQQNEPINNLLAYVIYEGVAEFVSVKAMGVPSAVPAIAYGKENKQVLLTFEREMFYKNNRHEWLWSDAPNDFGVRDLGYYIGYELCERYYEKAKDKQAAIKFLIELDYMDEDAVEILVDGSGLFSKPVETLYKDFQKLRPSVVAIKPFENNSQNVDPGTTRISIEFSEPMNVDYRNFDYGPEGAQAAVQIERFIGFSEDKKTMTVEIQPLKPNKRYQMMIGSGFRNEEGAPLFSYLLDFKTR